MWVLPSGLLRRSSNVGGTLTCAWCNSNKLKEVDRFPPDRIKYRCKVCGKPMTYVTTPMPINDINKLKNDKTQHPYYHIKRGMPKVVNIPGMGRFKIRPH